jgi:hypothetical protein
MHLTVDFLRTTKLVNSDLLFCVQCMYIKVGVVELFDVGRVYVESLQTRFD